jgi:hypothetical protein
MTMKMLTLSIIVLALGVARADDDDNDDTGWKILPGSISPDGKLGVLVGGPAEHDKGHYTNKLVVVKTKKVLAELDSEYFRHLNHGLAHPRWSPDGKTLVWYTESKWESLAVIVVRIENGKVEWKTEARDPAAVKKALDGAKRANPKLYDELEKSPQGFWVDVRPVLDGNKQRSLLPMTIRVTVASNVKGDPGVLDLRASMTGTVGAGGKLTFGKVTLDFAGTTPEQP